MVEDDVRDRPMSAYNNAHAAVVRVDVALAGRVTIPGPQRDHVGIRRGGDHVAADRIRERADRPEADEHLRGADGLTAGVAHDP